MASSKSRAGYAGAAELRRRGEESQGPAGYAGACPPLSLRSGATSASRLCPWTLAPACTSQGGSRFIAGVCSGAPSPLPGLRPAGSEGAPAASQAARSLAAALPALLVAAAPAAAADAVVSSRGCES